MSNKIDEQIYELALRGATRGRPTGLEIPEAAILGIVHYLTLSPPKVSNCGGGVKKLRKGVSIAQIAAQLPMCSYHEVSKKVSKLIDERKLRRLNGGDEVGKSARIVLPRKPNKG